MFESLFLISTVSIRSRFLLHCLSAVHTTHNLERSLAQHSFVPFLDLTFSISLATEQQRKIWEANRRNSPSWTSKDRREAEP
jgi:hypothetical protein